MTSSVSTTSVLQLQPRSRVTIWGTMRSHAHALSDEILRRALRHLSTSDLRQVAQVCSRWRSLAMVSIEECVAQSCPASLMPWNAIRRVFALLDSFDCRSAALVCARWRLVALCFFSPVLGRRHINNLPGEVLDHIFSYLDFESLRMAAQACLHWRDHGIDHPTFWRHIEARSATAGALDMLAARLGQSCGRPFSLTIDIEPPLRRAAEKRLMNLITAIMHTVQKLHIRVNAFCMLSLWPVLNWDAPELTSFSLKLYNPDRLMARIAINPWIFDSLPGKLREVTIEDVAIPTEHLTFPAFSNLRTLKLFYSAGTSSPFPAFVFEVCRDLEKFVFHCGILTYEETWSAAALEGLSRLTILDVHLDPPARDVFVARMPLLKDIPIVIMTTPPDEDAVYDFLAGVGFPFNFGLISINAELFKVLVEDDRTGYTRVMTEHTETYAPSSGPGGDGVIHPLLENALFPAQVQLLKISLAVWDLLVPYLGYYTALTKLIIELRAPDGTRVQRLDGTPLAFSALEVFVIDNSEPGCAFVWTDDILHFVDDVLQARRCRRLEVHRVFPRGDLAALQRRFEQVSYSPETHCRPIIHRTKMLV